MARASKPCQSVWLCIREDAGKVHLCNKQKKTGIYMSQQQTPDPNIAWDFLVKGKDWWLWAGSDPSLWRI